MTITDESVDTSAASEEGTEAQSGTEGKTGRKRDLDFTKFRETHKELADFVNANSGLAPVTPNQIKAILTLRSDFTNMPEQVAKRKQRRAELEAEKAKYVGMTDEQIKAAKAADRVEKQVAKMEARIQEARAKAQALREGKDASGADLAAQVEAEQNGSEEGGKRRIGRNR